VAQRTRCTTSRWDRTHEQLSSVRQRYQCVAIYLASIQRIAERTEIIARPDAFPMVRWRSQPKLSARSYRSPTVGAFIAIRARRDSIDETSNQCRVPLETTSTLPNLDPRRTERTPRWQPKNLFESAEFAAVASTTNDDHVGRSRQLRHCIPTIRSERQ